jgi:molybdopterin molybdotransferase
MNAIAGFSCYAHDLPRTEEVLSLLLSRLVPVGRIETVGLMAATGRILAHDAKAAFDVPPCDRSAMDGYAFRFGDTGPLQLVGKALAGKPHPGAVRRGECVAIATGGAVPDGCDTVAMREHCQVGQGGVSVVAKGQGANVRRRGEDFGRGAALLSSGTRLGARQIALLAAGALESVSVHGRLRVAILSMGDELADAAPDQICDANRPMLRALCFGNGFDVTDLGILPDSREQLADVLARAAADHDVIITTAGTSAGDEDHARAAIMDCGGQLLIAGAAIKPGKPVSFGQIRNTLCVALPGNPAAAYMVFLALGLPLLHHLSGRAAPPAPWHGVRAGFAYAKKMGLREYLRVRLRQQEDGTLRAERCGSDGSAMLASLAAGDGLVMLAEDCREICEGDLVPFATFQALELA